MFPRNNLNKKPIKIGSNPNKMKDMGAFIDNELKLLQSFKRWKNNPTSLNTQNLNLNVNVENKPISAIGTPIVVNNSMAESQNILKNSMSNKGFNPSLKTIDDTMRVSQTKFEGFSNVTKFTESNTNNTSQLIDKSESRRTRRPPSNASNKSEPFVIKFPQEQLQNKKNKDIL